MHFGSKPQFTPDEVLSTIQHHPEIAAITASYADGVTPPTRNPWQELDDTRALLREALCQLTKLRASRASRAATTVNLRFQTRSDPKALRFRAQNVAELRWRAGSKKRGSENEHGMRC